MNEKKLMNLQKHIVKQLTHLRVLLPTRVDPANISFTAKIPFKMLSARASLLWRSIELAESAFQCLKKNNLASGILLTRGFIETASMIWYLYKRVEDTIIKHTTDEFDDDIMSILFGSKIDNPKREAKNILTIIDKIDKEIKGYRRNYNILSEYAHPNHAGTHGLYARINKEEIYSDYGKNIKNSKMNTAAFSSISGSLTMIEHACNEMSKLEKEFISICEKDITEKSTTII